MNTALIRSMNIVTNHSKKVYKHHHILVAFDRNQQIYYPQAFKNCSKKKKKTKKMELLQKVIPSIIKDLKRPH